MGKLFSKRIIFRFLSFSPNSELDIKLQDHETEGDIENPYITLYDPTGDCWVALNTETFRRAQNELIHPHSEEIQMRFDMEDKRLYKVVATVGKQDHPFDWERR